MISPGVGISGLQQTTSYKVVLPFYVYAGISLLFAAVLLLLNTDAFHGHYFNGRTLSITHIMALGWGTMIILGASHQLLPVLIEGKLNSNLLAYSTFICTSIGIPLLVLGFYQFNFGWLTQVGAVLINAGVIFYLVNVFSSIYKSHKFEVHAWYVATAAFWLFSTTFFGLLLVFNFNTQILPSNSVAYLSIHAHLGLIGWFLLLVIGVGSRLIPMFLISKYTNNKTLLWIYLLINGSLISFILLRLLDKPIQFYYFSLILAFIAIVLFANHCKKAHKVRIRKNVDDQMKMSLLSVIQMLLPFVILVVVLVMLPMGDYPNLVSLYGFTIFFGWITAIIFGMTFKTLPFIVWNRTYHKKAHKGRTPAPKELFNAKVYSGMSIFYIAGFMLFILGIIFSNNILFKVGAGALLVAAILYVLNTNITLFHKSQ